MMQGFTQKMAQQQARALETMVGLQRQFQEAMQGVMIITKGEGKEGTSGVGFRGVPKPSMQRLAWAGEQRQPIPRVDPLAFG